MNKKIETNWTDSEKEHAKKIRKLFPNGVDFGVQGLVQRDIKKIEKELSEKENGAEN